MTRRSSTVLAAIALAAFVPTFGCERKPKPGSSAPPPASTRAATGEGAFGASAATYRGVLPAADGPGVEMTLNTWPDGIYYLRRVHQGRPGAFDELGRWELSATDSLLRLRGGDDVPMHFRLTSSGTLRALDREGQAIASAAPLDLTRAERFEAFEPRLRLRAVYQSVDGGAFLRDCATQRPVPVLEEGAAAALKDAYLKADGGLEQELLVVVEARFTTRPGAAGRPTEPAAVVERIFEVGPGKSCGERSPVPELEGRFWKVVRVGARPLGTLAPSRRVPGFRLEPAAHRLVGISTCNRIMGGYSIEGSALRFSAVAATQVACPDGMEFEAAFLEALEATRSWRFDTSTLELIDQRGEVRLRLEAVAGE